MDEHCSCRKSGSGSCVIAAFHAFVLSIGGKEVWHSAWIVVPIFVAEKDNFSSSTESLYGSLKCLSNVQWRCSATSVATTIFQGGRETQNSHAHRGHAFHPQSIQETPQLACLPPSEPCHYSGYNCSSGKQSVEEIHIHTNCL
jgi:hypothetical protein